jgi:hypothetical protein
MMTFLECLLKCKFCQLKYWKNATNNLVTGDTGEKKLYICIYFLIAASSTYITASDDVTESDCLVKGTDVTILTTILLLPSKM